MMSSYKCHQSGMLKSHNCVLIYKSETQGNKNHTPESSLIGLTTKMLKVKRLEEIDTCYSSSGLEKVTFFQCMKEVEKVKCFLEENSGELHSSSGKNEAKEQAWLNPGLKERTSITDERTSVVTEGSTRKNHLLSEKEKVAKLNKKNAEKTSASVAQYSFAICPPERGGEEEGFAARNSIAPSEKTAGEDISCTQSPKGQESNRAGIDRQAAVDKNECLRSEEGKNGLHPTESSTGRETEEGEATNTSRTALDQRAGEEQRADESGAGQPQDRCIGSIKALSTPGIRRNSASGSSFQNAEQTESAGSSKRRVAEEPCVDEHTKKSRTDVAGLGVEGALTETPEARQGQARAQAGPQESTGAEIPGMQDLVAPLDDVPAPAAPFDHRIVTAKQAAANSFYTVSKTEILGGGRFGQVHKCEEKATGLKLAAKIIKTRGAKDKEEVKNEISVMNQLDHVNLIQLYDAFETKNDIVLIMEYVEGGELFDRIIDETCSLTELDTILFVKQICEGIRHMHQMYILHLDLKPENILCVNRDTKQIKIIDFGLARRYKPREKLKVNFGTPEFLAPEVVNYDFVSFPTDMWSVGVIAYMLLSGLSPFLGDNDAETLSNILACRWDLEDEEFQDISDEAREFISKLLIKEKSWRISASEALKHPWLSSHELHARLHAQKCNSDAHNLMTK
ncbi:myosin light chain kinase family member 4 isoform X2 [Octodon degus]|uniref:Myosin light chain kinase family member 4 isoform X2 n=1 Tax=Octodon degus TaxID=10160 RepID=A0A6P6E6S8_OCTDE|nr:myosin light chain kinase family member 4 isoform X2 [Octodon degus]XP_023567843.1 myosin light chain kinase family member 4 isoform X2 [Octodon degus]